MKQQILLFDGTWNNEKSNTNVWRFCRLLPDGTERFYDEGVGNSWGERVRGGAFGFGLSQNIKDGYEYLCMNYNPGDEIYLFGFSRGAYTARSLGGMIRKCGILKKYSALHVDQGYELYRKKHDSPDVPEAVEFRTRHSHPVWKKDTAPEGTRIKMIGVWDTVGALGIPLSGVPFSREYYRFHNTGLSSIVENAFHAVAIDEHRKDYEATLWTEVDENNSNVEQRWFVGAHADVGGGYVDGDLDNVTLRWMQQKARECGLTFAQEAPLNPTDHLSVLHDSFKRFAFGLYALFHLGARNYRKLKTTKTDEPIDPSVKARLATDPKYRPQNLDGIV